MSRECGALAAPGGGRSGVRGTSRGLGARKGSAGQEQGAVAGTEDCRLGVRCIGRARGVGSELSL